MPKSQLTTEEIRKLYDEGVPVVEIAKQAGVTPPAVYYRLNPTAVRTWQKRHSDRRLSSAQTRKRACQAETLQTATVRGRWTKAEVLFMKQYAKDLTVLQVALALKRTYYSVDTAARNFGIQFKVE